jgi:hypothetical protein
MKSKLKAVLEFGGVFYVVGKPSFSEADLIEFISQFPELRCARY